MKKLLLLALLTASTSASWSQLASLTDGHGNVVNGELIVHWGDNETSDQEVSVGVTLNGTETKVINVRRYELDVEPLTQNYFCWAVCYEAVNSGTMPVWQAAPVHSLVLEPGVTANNFHAYHSPLGVLGQNTFRYVWFDVNNPTDSVWVDIQFQITSVGIEETGAGAATINVWPNPSAGEDVSIAYDHALMGPGAEVVVYNVLGDRIARYPMQNAKGVVRIAAGTLKTGVYFANIEQQGAILATRRLVISN